MLRAALADVTEDAFVKLNAIWALGALRPWRARSPEQWGELLEELVTSSESPSLVKQAGVALSECAPARRSWLARVAASKEPRLSSLAFWLRDGARKRDR